ncbi:hypothetical protein [Pseudomonas gingeri]|uniref:hypothetical protein n=1 Tax=Pseudomonas gingeri TaxID=117681 RepID=UPI0015A33738|nr:hypothetical protein [Pseudomonas gingeri]NWD04720.1 hypothetical protein [Pseudomonas gingeri]NWE30914.1 hypothetical protein [Pseudomonas gingeri]NWE58976.1 hypothetical protein [Pseudomonas gingeri]NWF02436.1 hypothetical protein [Pseudomonas gingeri]
MTKKITPDPPTAGKVPNTHEKDVFLCQILNDPSRPDESEVANAPRLLDTLTFTCSKPVTPQARDKPSLFAIQPGINAQDALTYVSHLLEAAELNGDEISLHANPVERALFWNMLHSVEVARAVVDALLEGSSSSGQALPEG